MATSFLAKASQALSQVPEMPLDQAVDLLMEARSDGRRVFIVGNGGSAATASHFVCDLVKTAEVEGLDPFMAFALCDNVPLVTALGNDVRFEQIFAEQVRALAAAGDVLIVISASGNSPNIIAGLNAAQAKDVRTIGLLGFDGGAALDLVDIAIHIPSQDYGVVEAAHSAITHAITSALTHNLEHRMQQAPAHRPHLAAVATDDHAC